MRRLALLGLLVTCWVCLLVSPSWAQTLTEPQYAQLRASLDGNPALAAQIQAGNWPALAAYMNAEMDTDGDPDPDPYWVWKTMVTESEIYETTTAEATVWSWPVFTALTVAQQQSWIRMFSIRGWVDASKPNVRQGIADIFPAGAQRTHLLTIARRHATRAEALFVVSGAGTTANPGVMTFEGMLSDRHVLHAYGGPLP